MGDTGVDRVREEEMETKANRQKEKEIKRGEIYKVNIG